MRIEVTDTLTDDIRHIREEVFMAEQGFQNEFDALDEISRYVVVYDGETAVATCRYYKEDDAWHIGRVCTLKAWRHKGLASLALNEALKDIGTQGGRVLVGAQVTAAPFYEQLGFTKTEDCYEDEGCPHVMMERTH